MQNFVYLIGDPAARECVVVDPAWEIDAIVDAAEATAWHHRRARHPHPSGPRGRQPESWASDIPGVEDLLGAWPAKVYVHKAEREFLRASDRIWSRWMATTRWPSGGSR